MKKLGLFFEGSVCVCVFLVFLISDAVGKRYST